MPGLLEEIKLAFGKSNLYEVLNVAASSSEAEIKKAYRKISLTVHPDKCIEKDREDATKKFQLVGKIYSILSDKNLRAVYDETGSVDEEDCEFLQTRDWYSYWRCCFPKLASDDIEQFEQKYRGSEEEKKDLINLYNKHKGDMTSIMSSMLCSTEEDEGRYKEILSELIQSQEIEAYDLFSKESHKRKRARRDWYEKERKECEEVVEKLKKKNNIADDDENPLSSLISRNMKSRQAQNDDFIKAMEEKYGSQGKKKPKNEKAPKATKRKGGK